jgi:hypothetical protein
MYLATPHRQYKRNHDEQFYGGGVFFGSPDTNGLLQTYPDSIEKSWSKLSSQTLSKLLVRRFQEIGYPDVPAQPTSHPGTGEQLWSFYRLFYLCPLLVRRFREIGYPDVLAQPTPHPGTGEQFGASAGCSFAYTFLSFSLCQGG